MAALFKVAIGVGLRSRSRFNHNQSRTITNRETASGLPLTGCSWYQRIKRIVVCSVAVNECGMPGQVTKVVNG